MLVESRTQFFEKLRIFWLQQKIVMLYKSTSRVEYSMYTRAALGKFHRKMIFLFNNFHLLKVVSQQSYNVVVCMCVFVCVSDRDNGM